MAEPGRVSRQPGWREVLLVAGAAVAVVLGAAILTSILPTGLQEVVFHSPLAIVVLIAGPPGSCGASRAVRPGRRSDDRTAGRDAGARTHPARAPPGRSRRAHPRDLGRRDRGRRDRGRRRPPRCCLARDAGRADRAGRHRRRDVVALVAADPRRTALSRAVPFRARARGPRRAVTPAGDRAPSRQDRAAALPDLRRAVPLDDVL